MPSVPSVASPAAGEAAGERFPCEQCGAILTYAPGTGELICAYCGHRNRVRETAAVIVENDLAGMLGREAAAAAVEVTATVKCGACAAEFTLPEGHHAGACPFCGSTVVTATGGNRHIKPAALLPFAIDATDAQTRLRRWLRGLWLAPTKLKDFARDGRLSGVYLPYWTFDSQTEANYAGQRGTVYHEQVRVSVVRNGRTVMETRTVQKVRWTPVRGHVSRAFDDVLVPASRSLPEPLLDALEPWDLHDLRPYTTAFLSGFQAEAYQLAVDQGFAVAQGKMRAALQQDVMADIGGDLQRIERMDVTHRRPSFKHVLLPVWLGAYRFKGRVFRLCVNGRTGEVQGERPWSAWKVLGAILLALLLAALVAYLYGHLPPPEL